MAKTVVCKTTITQVQDTYAVVQLSCQGRAKGEEGRAGYTCPPIVSPDASEQSGLVLMIFIYFGAIL